MLSAVSSKVPSSPNQGWSSFEEGGLQKVEVAGLIGDGHNKLSHGGGRAPQRKHKCTDSLKASHLRNGPPLLLPHFTVHSASQGLPKVKG